MGLVFYPYYKSKKCRFLLVIIQSAIFDERITFFKSISKTSRVMIVAIFIHISETSGAYFKASFSYFDFKKGIYFRFKIVHKKVETFYNYVIFLRIS